MIIGHTGDRDPFTYSGGVVIKDGDDYTWHFWICGDNEGDPVTYYSVDVPEDVLGWFDWVDISGICSCCDVDAADMRERSTSENVMDRVRVLEDIVSYHGGYQVCDGIEDTITEAELRERWEAEYDAFLKANPRA